MNESISTTNSWTPFTLSDHMRSAIKVALSLMLAYMIPMTMGWSQPTTAAITVMIIAAAGDTRQSLMAGSLRLVGTVAGAIIGLTLIACFFQERLYYLLSVSLVVSSCLYLYSAYQGDGTIFMLTVIVTLLVFNGGNADDAFLYGVDRAFMTIFGVAIYTLVCTFLWPDRIEQNLEADACGLLQLNRELFDQLGPGADSSNTGELTQRVAAAEQALQDDCQAAARQLDEVTSYRVEWRALIAAHRSLSRELSAIIEPEQRKPLDYRLFICDYDVVLTAINRQFSTIEQLWQNRGPQVVQPPIPQIRWRDETHQQLTHLEFARVVARVDSLRTVVQKLDQIAELADCISNRGTPPQIELSVPAANSFHWLDPESIKLGLRVLITFWLATAIWILLNPPGGFMFVTMCTLLLPMVSFSPLSPKSLYILFSMGFLVALPCYVFLLPALSRSYELALFIFLYALLGHYLFKGPVAIFFTMSLFTLGIGNTMNYDLAIILNVMLMIYLAITALVFIYYFIFNSKPEYLFNLMRQRFFRQTRQLLQWHLQAEPDHRPRHRTSQQSSIAAALTKMKLWASQVDTTHFQGNETPRLLAFAGACELVSFRTDAIINSPNRASNPQMQEQFQRHYPEPILGQALEALATREITGRNQQLFDDAAAHARGIEQRLDQLFSGIDTNKLREEEVALFYHQLNQASLLWLALVACHDAAQAIDWQELGESRF